MAIFDQTLGRKEGLPESEQMQHERTEMKMEAMNLLTEYMFLTDQMGWKQGIKIFQEQGEESIKEELQQFHDMEGFQSKHSFDPTTR